MRIRTYDLLNYSPVTLKCMIYSPSTEVNVKVSACNQNTFLNTTSVQIPSNNQWTEVSLNKSIPEESDNIIISISPVTDSVPIYIDTIQLISQ